MVGGGVVGAAAAWRLAAHGHHVTLVERFGLGHRQGASHGTARIFRHAYPDPTYVSLAARALAGWLRLERQTGAAVYERTGAVDHGDPVAIRQLARALGDAGLEFQILSPTAAGPRWPGLRFDTVVLHHPQAGRLHADRAVAALCQAATSAGAVLRPDTPVRAIRPRADRVEVVLDDEVLRPDQVVVAGGAWTEKLVGRHVRLPALRTTQEQPAHFPSDLAADRWPAFIHHPTSDFDMVGGIYGLASVDGVKIGEHGTGPVVDPDGRDHLADPAGVERLRAYARAWVPGVDAAGADPLTCLYTTTPDHHFVIDRVGPITIAAGFSGHGFKFGPALGELVLDLVEDRGGVPDLFSLRSARAPSGSAR